MNCTKEILTESRNTVNQLLQVPNINPAERLQYKLMKKNLNGMLNIIVWLENMRQCKKAR